MMVVLIAIFWNENYGDASVELKRSFITALSTIQKGNRNIWLFSFFSSFKHLFCFEDRRVMYLGLIQSFFEGSMYVFILQWTPAITSAVSHGVLLPGAPSPTVPYGYIFSSFMASVLISFFKNIGFFIEFHFSGCHDDWIKLFQNYKQKSKGWIFYDGRSAILVTRFCNTIDFHRCKFPRYFKPESVKP